MTIEDDIAFLETVPALSILGRQALRILAIGAESRYVHRGEALFTAGEQADCGYVVQEGSVRVKGNSERDSDTEETIVGPGTMLSEVALITETVRTQTVTAAEPSIVIRIPRGLFLKMLEGFPDAARRLRDTMAARNDQITRDIDSVKQWLHPPGGRR